MRQLRTQRSRGTRRETLPPWARTQKENKTKTCTAERDDRRGTSRHRIARAREPRVRNSGRASRQVVGDGKCLPEWVLAACAIAEIASARERAERRSLWNH
ncbi:hypothetical protein MRX96_048110 [Rhipicephalus microplus]